MLQLSPVPATPYAEPLNIGAGRRALAIGLAVLISALLLLMLLTFGSVRQSETRTERVSVVSIEAREVASDAPEPSDAKPEPSAKPPEPRQPAVEEAPSVEPIAPQAAQPTPAPPVERPLLPAPARPAMRPPGGAVYGPPDTGGSSSSFRDSERVGTAPNGEPLYAATWYREPSDGELRGYLSTASGPGWGLIACRTAPDYRVEDCVGLDEYPTGSQINRAVLAAAWQFQVRPPRRGGKLLVGSWVRIRIDYVIRGR
ncbi:MAG: hypothetical protein C0520_03790 [Sphingopyxis sp.]|nr:hypothetical protein [Sphingopyxis sp.]